MKIFANLTSVAESRMTPYMKSWIRIGASLVCTIAVVVLSLAFDANGTVTTDIKCSSTCPAMLCEGGDYYCIEIYCCKTEDLPCTADDVWIVECHES